MDERHKTGRGALLACTLLIGLFLLFATFPSVLAANDPGHDSLYVLLTGDSNIVGNLNISNRLNASNLKFATLLYGDYLDVRANGSIYTPSSRPALQADTNDLYLDSLANVYIATRAGTTGRVQIGPTTGSGITLNVSGTILQQNVRVCLANGSNCASGNNTGNVSTVTAGSGLANSGTAADPVLDVNVGTGIEISSDAVRIAAAAAGSGLAGGAGSALDVTAGDGLAISADQVIINNASVCRSDGVGCPAGAAVNVGLTNTSGSGNISLTNSNVNVSLNTLFIDNTNGRVGVGTRGPESVFHVNKTVTGNAAGGGTVYETEAQFTQLSTGEVRDEDTTLITRAIYAYANISKTTQNDAVGENVDARGIDVRMDSSGTLGDTSDSITLTGVYTQSAALLEDSSMGSTTKYGVQSIISGTAGSNYGLYTTVSNSGVNTQSTGVFATASSSGVGSTAYGLFVSASGAGTNYAIYSAAGNNTFAGNVGIGTASPTQKLHVIGNANVSGGNINIQTGTLTIAGATAIDNSRVGSFATGTTVNALGICLADGTNCLVSNTNAGGGWLNTTNQVYLANNLTNVSAGSNNDLMPNLFIDNTNGRVGVGTASPYAVFMVNSSSVYSDYAFIATSPDSVNGPSGDSPGILLAGARGKTNGVLAGGNGGFVTIYGGTGGSGSLTHEGMAGGNVTITAGDGGEVVSSVGAAGTAGAIVLSTGHGGNTPSTGNGSNGGDFLIITGIGGNASGASAGRGGNLTIILGNGGNSSSNGASAGDGGSFILRAGDGGVLGKGYIGTGGSIYLTPGFNSAEAGTNGSIIITRGGLGIGARTDNLLETFTNITTTGVRPHPFILGHTIYGNASFGTAFLLAAQHQLTTNTGVVISMNIGDGLVHNNKNVTRFEVFRIAPTLGATYNGTVTQLQMVKLVDPVRSNGSITTLVGYYSDDLTTGSTNNRGMQLAVTSGTGKHNLYLSGTANNYIVGNVGIGVQSPARKLEVSNGTVSISTYGSADDSGNPIALTLTGNSTWIFVTPVCGGCYTPGATVGDLVIRATQSFIITTSGGSADTFVVKNNSFVGINTSTPANTLNVVGDFNVTGMVYGVAPTMYLTSATQDANHNCDDTPANCCAGGYHMCTVNEMVAGGREIEDTGTGRDATVYNVAGDADPLADAVATDCTGWSTIGGTDDRMQCTITTTVTCAITANVCSASHPVWCCSD